MKTLYGSRPDVRSLSRDVLAAAAEFYSLLHLYPYTAPRCLYPGQVSTLSLPFLFRLTFSPFIFFLSSR